MLKVLNSQDEYPADGMFNHTYIDEQTLGDILMDDKLGKFRKPATSVRNVIENCKLYQVIVETPDEAIYM